MLSKEEVLARTDKGLNVFKHYLPFPFRVGRNFLNPLYEDTKASCNVYFDRTSGQYKLKDYGNDTYSGDCFHFVAQLLGTDSRHADGFIEILKKINQDLSLGLDENKQNFNQNANTQQQQRKISLNIEKQNHEPLLETKSIKPFSFKIKPFSDVELKFWNQYGITLENLKKYQVVSLHEFSSENNNGKPYKLFSTEKEPIFAYQGKRYVKLYRPFSNIRFQYAGDLGEKYCFGLEQLPTKGNTLFITGGEKDVLTLVSNGFHAICFNS